MTGRLFLHIGPPKTATTSLQYALQSAEREWFVYGGVHQPRGPDRNDLCRRVHDLCRHGGDDTDAVAELHREIDDALASGRHLILSEEMFLVYQHGASQADKLFRLASLTTSLPRTVLLTVRDPVVGMESLYQEIFRSLPLDLQVRFDRFVRHERGLAFDYARVLRLLEEVGFEDVRLLDFEALTRSSVPLRVVFGDAAPAGETIDVPRVNEGRKVGGSAARALPNVTAKAVADLPWVRRLAPRERLRRLPGFETVKRALEAVELRPEGARSLEIPEDVARHLRAGYARARARAERGHG